MSIHLAVDMEWDSVQYKHNSLIHSCHEAYSLNVFSLKHKVQQKLCTKLEK